MAVRLVYFHNTQRSRREVVDADLSDYFTAIPHPTRHAAERCNHLLAHLRSLAPAFNDEKPAASQSIPPM
jgi:hypothetical protein